MAEKDKFAQREHWLEEEYFGKKNQELIEKMRQKRAREADRQKMSEMMGVNDQEVLEALQDLGYTSETIQLLHVVPLVEVAWTEGGVADREREMIYKIAQARGVQPDSAAHELLSHWMENKPSGRFFENSLRAIRVVLESTAGRTAPGKPQGPDHLLQSNRLGGFKRHFRAWEGSG